LCPQRTLGISFEHLIGAAGRYVIFQMAEVAVPKELFQKILRLIRELRSRPAPAEQLEGRMRHHDRRDGKSVSE
jgi:hypothetical protein